MAYKSGGNEVVEGDVVNEAGAVLLDSTVGAQVAAIATADATDEASAIVLANATKAKVNALLAVLQVKRFPIA